MHGPTEDTEVFSATSAAFCRIWIEVLTAKQRMAGGKKIRFAMNRKLLKCV